MSSVQDEMSSVLDSPGSHELLRCSTEELALLRDAQLRTSPRRASPRSPRSRLNSADLSEMKRSVRDAVAATASIREVTRGSRGDGSFFFSPPRAAARRARSPSPMAREATGAADAAARRARGVREPSPRRASMTSSPRAPSPRRAATPAASRRSPSPARRASTPAAVSRRSPSPARRRTFSGGGARAGVEVPPPPSSLGLAARVAAMPPTPRAAATPPTPRPAAVDEEDAALQRRIDAVAAELARLKELQRRQRLRRANPEADRPSPTT